MNGSRFEKGLDPSRSFGRHSSPRLARTSMPVPLLGMGDLIPRTPGRNRLVLTFEESLQVEKASSSHQSQRLGRCVGDDCHE